MTKYYPGLFISFEGGEGAGKSTQVKNLASYFQSKNIPYVCTREPGGTNGAEDIRQLLVTGDASRWDDKTELLLMLAARANHLHDLIIPALKNGEYVICDRFFDSTLAYQGYGRGMEKNTICSLHEQLFHNIQPDITFILDLPAENGLDRAKKRLVKSNNNEDRFESNDLGFHHRVRKGFLAIARNNPNRCHILNGLENSDDIFAKIKLVIEENN